MVARLFHFLKSTVNKHSTFRKICTVALPLLFGCLALPASAADEEKQALVLTLKNGETVSWFLEKRPKVSYSVSELLMEANGTTVTYPFEEVDRCTFAMLATGIASPINKQGTVSVTQNELRFYGMKPGTVASVYSADGRKLQSVSIASDGTAVISLANLSAGTYIINYGVSTCKILKQ